MNAPAGLAGAALLLWGLAVGVPLVGAALGVAIEGLRLGVTAAPPAARDTLGRLAGSAARVSLVLGLLALPALALAQGAPQGLYAWLRWLPAMWLALPAWQLLRGRLTRDDLRGRWAAPQAPATTAPPIDLTHAHAAIALAAAGTGPAPGVDPPAWLYPAIVAVVAWALLARVAPAVRLRSIVGIAAAALAGWALSAGLRALQLQVEAWSTDLIASWITSSTDPSRERTRIGDLGRIKLSDRIVMRVAPLGPRPDSLLLREAAFARYRGGEWLAVPRGSRPVWAEGQAIAAGAGADAAASRWRLGDAPERSRVTLRRSIAGGRGLLALPAGAQWIEGLPARSVAASAHGAVQVDGAPRWVALTVGYDPEADREVPVAADLEVPERLRDTLAGLAASQGLRQDGAAHTVAALQRFFAAHFGYALDLGRASAGGGGRTLVDFLLHDRQGHCEYFATATVLLLRQSGVPARYVGGYSASEFDEREQAFVVRARHAHAWAEAWVDGRWIAVDTTPAQWAQAEREAARGAFGPLLDWLSWRVDHVLSLWIAATPGHWLGLAAGAAGSLGLVIALRRLARRPARTQAGAAAVSVDPVAAAWLELERHAARQGLARAPDETVRAWLRRLRERGAAADSAWGPGGLTRLADLAAAYHAARFDPAASAGQRQAFVDAARRWAGADGRGASSAR